MAKAPEVAAASKTLTPLRTSRFAAQSVVVALSFMLLIFVCFSLFTFNQQSTMISYRSLLLQSYHRVSNLDTILSLLQEAEAGQRGYLLSHEEKYLDNFEKATSELPGVFKKLLSDSAFKGVDRSELQRVQQLSVSKVDELKRTIELERAGSTPSAREVFKSGVGRATMLDIRSAITSLNARGMAERTLIERHLRDFTTRSTAATTVVLIVAVVALFCFAAIVVRLFAANLNNTGRSLADALEITRARDRLDTVLTSMDEGLLLIDTTSSVTFANQSAEELFGVKQEQLIGKSFHQLFAGTTSRELSEYLSLDSVFEKKNNLRHLELQLVREGQKSLSVSATASPLLQDDVATGAVLTFFDTTAQVESEKRLQAQFEITKILARQLPVENTARKIIELICEQFDWSTGVAFVLNDEETRLLPLAFAGSTETERFGNAISGVQVDRGQCLAGRVWQTELPIWEEDLCATDNFTLKEQGELDGIHAAIGVPFFSRQKFYGVLIFYAREVREKDQSRLVMLSAICAQLGQYLEISDARQMLIANERKFRAIFDKQFELIGLLSVDGKVIDANLAALRMGGTTIDQVQGQDFWKGPWWAHSEAAQERVKQSIAKAAQGEFDRFETEHFAGDQPVYIDFSMQPLLDDEGKVVMLIPEGRDITSLKLAQEKLAESEAMFRRLTENVKAIFWISTLDGKILYLSPAYELITAGKVDAILADSELFFAAVREEDTGFLRDLLKNPSGVEVQFRLVRAEQNDVWISARSFPIFDHAGQIIQICGVAEDISDRKQAEKRVSEFYSTVSHELRSPLTSIRGSLGLIEGGLVGDVSEEAGTFINIARVESDRLIRMINSILDLDKIEAGKLELKMQETVPDDLVGATLDNLQGMTIDAGVTLKKGANCTESIKLDRDRITQVLTNLISNSIKFSPKNSVITVSSEKRGSSVRFSISDQGAGIKAQDLPKLFGKFKQLDSSDSRSHGGTGLGLAISKALVEQHGGTIGVDSEVGKGSTFWFELPTKSATKGT